METAELEWMARQAAEQMSSSPPQIIAEPTPTAAWQRASATGSELICITGSFFLAADMADVMRKTKQDLKSEI
jgi:folylpolyglutamate synthase/dihydropteroate synthase